MSRIFRKTVTWILAIVITVSTAQMAGLEHQVTAASSVMTNSSTEVDIEKLQVSVTDRTDTDGDGIYDEVERIIATNENSSDSDGDGIDDCFELYNGLDPLRTDTNGDGLDDLYEITCGQDIGELTTADDLDADEIPGPGNTEVDSDSDGIRNLDDPDNDNDGIRDMADLSPFSSVGVKDSHRISLKTDGGVSIFRIQLSPADVDHLIEYGRAMTWPVDNEGTVRNIDGSVNDLNITPMLKVIYDSDNCIPDEATRTSYGYMLQEEDGEDVLLVPLQVLEQDGHKVGYEATLYIPEGTGTDRGDHHEVAFETMLQWLLTYKNDNINRPTIIQAPVCYGNQQLTMNNFDVGRATEFLGMETGHYGGGSEPDLVVFYSYYFDDHEESNVIYYNIYYDLTYDEGDECYRIDSLDNQNQLVVWDETYFTNKIYDDTYDGSHVEATDYDLIPDKERFFHYDGKYAFDIVGTDEEKVAALYYTSDESSGLFGTAHYATLFEEAGGDPDQTWSEIGSNMVYSADVKNDGGLYSHLSKVRDSAVCYDEENETFWYLYASATPDSDNTSLTLKGIDGDGETKHYLDYIDEGNNEFYFYDDSPEDFMPMELGLGMDVFDINNDGAMDLLYTRRDTGVARIIMDVYNWNNRKDDYTVDYGFQYDNLYGLTAEFIDMDLDGQTDLAFPLAVMEVVDQENPQLETMNLSFEMAVVPDIQSRTELLLQETEAFDIKGIQVENDSSVEIHILTDDDMDHVMAAAIAFDRYYRNSAESLDSFLEEFEEEALDGHNLTLAHHDTYSHFYEAVLGVGSFFGDWYDSDRQDMDSLLVLSDRLSKTVNLDEYPVQGDTDVLTFNTAEAESFTSREMSLKWTEDGLLLDYEGISAMVDSDADGTMDFGDSDEEVKEYLARLHTGEGNIVSVGGQNLPEHQDTSMSKGDMYAWFRVPLGAGSGVGFIVTKFGVEKLPAVDGVYQATINNVKMAKYSKYVTIGNVSSKLGLAVDIVAGVYTGFMYGITLGEMGANQDVVLTSAVVMSTLLVGLTVLSNFLMLAWPVGTVIWGIMLIDSIASFLFENYNGAANTFVESVVRGIADFTLYEGTYLTGQRMTDYDVVFDGPHLRPKDEISVDLQYVTDVRAYNRETPANDPEILKQGKASYYSDFITYQDSKVSIKETDFDRNVHTERVMMPNEDIYIDSLQAINEDNSDVPEFLEYVREINPLKVSMVQSLFSDDDTYDEIWHEIGTYDIHQDYSFKVPVINGYVIRKSYIDLKVVESVSVSTIAGYEKDPEYTWYERDNYDFRDELLYYDVLPETLEQFFDCYRFVASTEPRVMHNEIGIMDWDGDGLVYFSGGYEEDSDGNRLIGSGIYDYDSDDDGLNDYTEVQIGSDGAVVDTDGDGLTDYEEYLYYTDATLTDTDGDGLSDWEELMVPVDFTITVNSSGAAVTAQAYSDPLQPDTDGDGQDDLAERSAGTNPASMYTNGSTVWDGNLHMPVVSRDFASYYGVSSGEALVINLNDHITDGDDDLSFAVSHGDLDEGVLTYVYDKDGDGESFELTVFADDSRGGELETAVLICEDRDEPTLIGLEVNGAEETGPLDVEEAVYAVTAFEVIFNEEIFIDDSSLIEIVPVDRAYLDVDGSNATMGWDVTVSPSVSSSSALVIQRSDELVQNGIGYELRIPSEAIVDRSDNPLLTDYVISFETVDTTLPVMMDMSTAVTPENPLTMTFNEPVLYNHQIYVTDMTDGTSKFRLYSTSSGGMTVTLDVQPNELDSYTVYACSQYSDNRYVNRAFVTDEAGNDFLGFGPMDTFTTGDTQGPLCLLPEANGIYGTTLSDGTIEIPFDSVLYEGEGFDEIVLTYGFNLTTYGFEIESVHDVASQLKLPATVSIDGNRLLVTPKSTSALIDYGVIIPADGLEDSFGYGVSGLSQDDDHQYLKVRAVAGLEVPLEIIGVASIRDRSNTNFVTNLLAGLGEDRLTSDSIYVVFNGQAYRSAAYSDNLENVVTVRDSKGTALGFTDKGSFTEAVDLVEAGLYLRMDEPLEPGTYTVEVPAGLMISSDGRSSLAQTYSFDISGSYSKSGLVDFGADMIQGAVSEDGAMFVGDKYETYAAMVDGAIAYQWYLSDTEDFSDGAPVAEANDMFYEPGIGTSGKYAFLQITITYADGSYSEVTPAIGPIGEGLQSETELTDLQVMAGGSNLMTAFDAAIDSYAFEVGGSCSKVLIQPVYDEILAMYVTVNGVPQDGWSDLTGHEVSLDLGLNRIEVTAYSEDMGTMVSYLILVTRDSDTGAAEVTPETMAVEIEGNEGEVLTGTYTFIDPMDRGEGDSIYRWFRDDGSGSQAIEGTTGQQYAPDDDDEGAYFLFEVTPVTSDGVAGEAKVGAEWYGPVALTGTVSNNDDDSKTASQSADTPQPVPTLRATQDPSGVYVQAILEEDFGDSDRVRVTAGRLTIELPKTMLPERGLTELVVSEEAMDLLPEALLKVMAEGSLFDMTLRVDGEIVPLKAGTQVRVTAAYDNSQHLAEHQMVAVYIDGDGNMTVLPCSYYQGGSLSFITNHFSLYGIAIIEKQYDDLAGYDWAVEAVEALASRMVIKGTSETGFSPGKAVSRGDFITLLVRYFDFDGPKGDGFADVPEDSYYSTSVRRAQALGIVNGVGDDRFAPMAEISRQDMMLILARAIDAAGQLERLTESEDGLSKFADSGLVATYAYDSVDYLTRADLIHGSDGYLNPRASVTRAEAAVLLYNLLKETLQ